MGENVVQPERKGEFVMTIMFSFCMIACVATANSCLINPQLSGNKLNRSNSFIGLFHAK